MAVKTAQQIVEKFQRGVASAGPDYAAGVANPSQPWAEATAKGADRWKAGLQKAIADGSFQRGVARAGNEKWQRKTSTVGAERYAAAAASAAQEFARVADQIVAAGQSAQRAANAMPDTTLEQRLQRAVAGMKAVSDYWKGRGR